MQPPLSSCSVFLVELFPTHNRMQFFILVAIIALNIASIRCDNIQEQFIKVRTVFLDVVKEQCYQNSTDGHRRFTELVDNATKCLDSSFRQSPIFVTPLKSFKDNVQSCVNDLVEEMEDCLPEASKDWPQMNFDILYSLLDFAYENKEQLFSPKVRSFVERCVNEFRKDSSPTEYTKCLNFFNADGFDIKVTCHELLGLSKCFLVHVNKRCPGDDSIEKLKLGFMESLREPCAEFDVTDSPVDNVFTLLAPYAPPNINPDLM